MEPDDISRHIKSNKLNLTHILITHHHWDHSGGTLNLLSLFKDQPIHVVGFDDRIEALNHRVNNNDFVNIGNLIVKCIFTPCHTKGHMSYFVNDSDNPSLFSGDTLFVAGCGKFFEGTATDMHECIKSITALPITTKIYCGHEYTVKNLEFALSIDSQNADIAKKLDWARQQRKNNHPTVPTTLSDELRTNPYLQTSKPSYQTLTGENDPISIIAALRRMKDRFK